MHGPPRQHWLHHRHTRAPSQSLGVLFLHEDSHWALWGMHGFVTVFRFIRAQVVRPETGEKVHLRHRATPGQETNARLAHNYFNIFGHMFQTLHDQNFDRIVRRRPPRAPALATIATIRASLSPPFCVLSTAFRAP